VEVLAESLKFNSSLAKVDLNGNKISDIGMQALGRAF